MTKENIDISINETGSTVVKRKIEDIGTAAGFSASAIDRLNEIIKRLDGLSSLLTDGLYSLKIPIDGLGLNLIGLGSGFNLIGYEALQAYSKISAIGQGFVMLSNEAIAATQSITGLGQGFIMIGSASSIGSSAIGNVTNSANQASSSLLRLTFNIDDFIRRMSMARQATSSFKTVMNDQLRITDQSNRNTGSLVIATQKYGAALVGTSSKVHGFKASLEDAGDNIIDVNGKIVKSEIALHGFLRTLLSLSVIRQLTSDVVRLADEWTRTGNRLRQVSTDQGDLIALQEQAYVSAQRTRSGMEEMVTLYTRTAMATENLKLSQKDLWDITETVAMSMKLNGGSVEETAQAMRQLSQAFNKGKLDGDEFRSIMENAPQLQKLFAESLGVTKGQLYEMSAEGGLTLDKLITAIKKGGPAIRENFTNSIPTAKEGTVAWANATEKFVGRLNEATGATKIFYMSAQVFADNVWLAIPAIGMFGTALAIAFGPSIINQIRLFGVATVTALGPWGLLAVAAVGLGLALFALKDKFNQLDPATKAAVATFAGLVTVVGGGLAIFIGLPAILAGVSTAVGILGGSFAAASALVTGTLIPAIVATAPIWATLLAAIVAITAAVYVFVKYKDQWADVFKHVVSAANMAIGIFVSLPGVFTKAGRDTLQGLIKGFLGEVGHVIKVVNSIATDIITKFKSVLGIKSPSTVFIEHGRNIGQGLVIGMDNSLSDVAAASKRLAEASNMHDLKQQKPKSDIEQLSIIRNDVLALTNQLLTEAEEKTLNLASSTDILNRALEAHQITQKEYNVLMERSKAANSLDPNAELRSKTTELIDSLLTEDQRRVKSLIASTALLKQSLDASLLTTEEYNTALDALNKKMAPEQKPTASTELKAMQDDMLKEIDLLRLGTREREIQRELQYRINDLKQRSIDLDPLQQQALENSIRQLDKARQQSELVGEILDKAFSRAEDAFSKFVKTGKLDFKELIGSMLEDVARFTAEEAFFRPLKEKLQTIISDYLGTMGKGSSDGLPNLFIKTLTGLGTSSSSGSGSGSMGFATGANFQVGGYGGVDSQLVSFRASPKEKVKVYRSNDSSASSGTTSDSNRPINYYSIDARGSANPAEVEASVNRALDERVPGIIKVARQETLKDVQQISTRQRL